LPVDERRDELVQPPLEQEALVLADQKDHSVAGELDAQVGLESKDAVHGIVLKGDWPRASIGRFVLVKLPVGCLACLQRASPAAL
jgi:hypothetical protein